MNNENSSRKENVLQTEKELMEKIEKSISPEPTDLIEFLNTFEDKYFFDLKNPQSGGNYSLISFSFQYPPEDKNIYWFHNPQYWTVLPEDTCFILSENKPERIEYHLRIPKTCDVIKNIDYIFVAKNGEVIENFGDQISTHLKIGDKILKNHSPTTLLPLLNLPFQESYLVLTFSQELFQKINTKYPLFKIILKYNYGILSNPMRKYIINRPNLKFYNYWLYGGLIISSNNNNQDSPIAPEFKDSLNKISKAHGMFFTEKKHKCRYKIPKSDQFINNFSISISDMEGEIYANIINYVNLSAGPYTIAETTHDYDNPKYTHEIILPEDFPNDFLCFTDVWLEFTLFQPLNKNQYIDIKYDRYSYKIPSDNLKQNKGKCIIYNKKFIITYPTILDPPTILSNNNAKIELSPLHPNDKDDYPHLSEMVPQINSNKLK